MINSLDKAFQINPEPYRSVDDYLYIFSNDKIKADKAKGIDFILSEEGIRPDNIDPNLQILMLGDSSSDLKAMKRLKALFSSEKQILAVSVGPDIHDGSVDITLKDHQQVQEFLIQLDELYQKNRRG